MLPSFRLGTLLGFPVRINWSFLLMLAMVWLFVGGAAGVLVTAVAFASVLVHELGHAVVARKLGVTIKEIEFQFFGGAAKMLGLPGSARDEILIAAAGPAVSFALAGLSGLVGLLGGGAVFAFVATVNLIIGAFNLLPALPMDGGRILRAVLASRMGFLPATRLAIRIARWLAFGLAVVGVLTGHFMLVPLAIAVFVMGLFELAAAHVNGGYGGERRDPFYELLSRLSRAGMPAGFGRRPQRPVDEDEGDVEYIPPGGRKETPPRGSGPGGGRVFIVRL